MRDLIERVGALTRPSDEVDARVRCALLADDDAYVAQSPFNGAWCIYKGERQGTPKLYEPRRSMPHDLWRGEYTSSIDAAVALVKCVRPGWHWYVDDRSAAVWPDGIYDESAVQAATPAIALVLALLNTIASTSTVSETSGE